MKKGVRLTKEQFINKANSVHGDTYSYSLSLYKNTDTKLIIICQEHGEFLQSPHNHLSNKQGCPKCKAIQHTNRSKGSTEDFIIKAKNIHEDKYNYSLVEYKNTKTKVEIICPAHGSFYQTPNNHLRLHGCYVCGSIEKNIKNKNNPMSWKTTDWILAANKSLVFDSFKVYIIRCWNEEEEFYKIGKTFSTVKKRFKSKNLMPYNYEVVNIFEGHAIEISKLEKKLQKENKNNKYIPNIKFLGVQECFKKINNGK